ncbi:MAG: UDP-N-acetylglucosamine 4,6-dehydratase (inverting) [Syntrophomonadaceae bacterium]|nr:UDP-N-acetylglucosamine 4,6-dehydratase (inverting) [Bacillota bacterium]
MTRFILSLDTAINIIMEAIRSAEAGDIYVPGLPSVKILDLAEVMIGERKVEIKITGVRPGEKIHEILISEEEIPRTIKRGDYYIICPVLPKLRRVEIEKPVLTKELSSANYCMSTSQLKDFLQAGGYLNF